LGSFLGQLGLRSGAFLLTPSHLGERFVESLKSSLEENSIPCRVLNIEDGDANKNLEQVSGILDRLAAAGANRDNVIVNVGGGVACDIGGFVASVYMRGLTFAQVPTTLLAQVDAGIGGKVGVNHPRAKNLIGSFYQPHLVLCDPLMLDGLPLLEIVNGMAEVVKTAIIGSRELYETLLDKAESKLEGASETDLRDSTFLERCVFECARVKTDIVEQDPYEGDLRRALNLGHTIGHALETASEYEGLKHGEAVALGTIAAIRVAMSRNRTSKLFLDKTISIFNWCGLPTKTPPFDRDVVRDALSLDKKREAGRLRFVLPLAPGEVEIINDAGEDELLDALLT
jgi:3-dehydroquinate synthase